MRKLTLALAAAGCLAFATTPALAIDTITNTRPSGDVSANSGLTNQKLAQAQYNSTKKKNESNTQDQTRRKSWGGGGY